MFRDRLTFDPDRGEYRDGDIRYMMIRPDALMGMIAELPDHWRGEALAAFARSIRRFGGRSARSYQAASQADPDALLRTIQDTAPQLGWGRWSFARTPNMLSLMVENSPFAAHAGHSAPHVCHPICGMLTAVGEMVLGGEVHVTETHCAVAGETHCKFTVEQVPDRQVSRASAAAGSPRSARRGSGSAAE